MNNCRTKIWTISLLYFGLLSHSFGTTAISSSVEFPGDIEIQMTWRSVDLGIIPQPPWGEHYKTLKQEALNGDPRSAFGLFSILDSCKYAVETKEELDKKTDRIRETHMVVVPAFGEDELHIENLEGVDIAIQNLEMEYERCTPITAAQKSEAGKWLELAKDNGPPLGIEIYGSQLSDASEAISYFERAWQAGSIRSLHLMAEKYLELYNSGENPTGHISAYAAQFAYTRLLESRRINFDSAQLGFDVAVPPEEEIANRNLQETGGLLQNYQIQEAIEHAKEMISSNSACCYPF